MSLKIIYFLIGLIILIPVSILIIMMIINLLTPSNLYKPERSYNVYSSIGFSQEFIDSGDYRLDVWWMPHPESQEVLLYFHGNSGRIVDLFPFFISQYNVISVAYPGYHHSEGEPSKDSINQAALDIYDYVKSEHGFKDEQIIIYGHSMGGAPATYLAARREKAQKLILVNTFASVKSMCSLEYGFLCGFVSGQFDSTVEARKVKIPVRQYHLTRDPVVPINQGRQLFENFENSKDKEFIELRDGVHSVFDVSRTLR